MNSLLALTFLWALTSANIVKREVDNECYRCSRWDTIGNGYMPSDIPGECGTYRQCFKVAGEISEPIYRFCPPGTWTDFFDAANGNPCTKTECDPDICNDCAISAPTTPPQDLMCPFIQGSPEWIIDVISADTGLPVQYGSCGVNGLFNDTDGVCTCTEVGQGCSCRINIPMEADIDDVSCNKAWVGQTGMPAMVDIVEDGAASIFTHSGSFGGFNGADNNGAHISTYSLDGAFAGGWVFQLTFTAWFKLDTSYAGERWGVLTMGDCAAGPAFAIWVDNFKVQGHIEVMDGVDIEEYVIESDATVSVDQWYFVSVVYDSGKVDSLKLYMFDESQYSTCFSDPGNPDACPQATTALDQPYGPLSPRGCGLTMGHTSSNDETEFFNGNIARVKINMASDNLFGCL